MPEVTITISLAGAMNLKSLVEARMREIEKLAEEYPELPMKDPSTWSDYRNTLYQLDRETSRVYDRIKQDASR